MVVLAAVVGVLELRKGNEWTEMGFSLGSRVESGCSAVLLFVFLIIFGDIKAKV